MTSGMILIGAEKVRRRQVGGMVIHILIVRGKIKMVNNMGLLLT